MKLTGWAAGLTGTGVLVIAGLMMGAEPGPQSGSPTFTKDVLPILEQNCQECHRPNNIAPMSFLTYDSTRPWAKAIKSAVVTRKMPPWFADPAYSHFANDRSLSAKDTDTLVRWVDGGAPQGDPKDAPPARQFPANGWTTKPDVVLNGVPFTVPAHPPNNVIEWRTLTTATNFTQDTYVTSVEIKPSELGVTHHICISFVPHRADAQYNTMLWTDKDRDAAGVEVAPSERKNLRPTADGKGAALAARPKPQQESAQSAQLRAQSAVGIGFTCYVPGRALSDFRPYNAAVLVPAGYDINWNIHYTPNGTELTDRPEIGLTIAKEKPEHLLIESGTGTDEKNFAIPANDADYKPAPGVFVFNTDAELRWLSPHMHLRGKAMQYKLIFPDGREQVVLNVPHYDFNWQLGYELAKPIKVTKGTKLVVVAEYDNSANNKFNPDPNRTVYYGNMTWEEMFAPFFAITVDKNVDPGKAITAPRGAQAGA